MAYEKQTWTTGEVITEEKLNHIEEGIAGVFTLTKTDFLSLYAMIQGMGNQIAPVSADDAGEFTISTEGFSAGYYFCNEPAKSINLVGAAAGSNKPKIMFMADHGFSGVFVNGVLATRLDSNVIDDGSITLYSVQFIGDSCVIGPVGPQLWN